MEILQGVWGAIVDIFQNSGYAYFFTDGGYKNALLFIFLLMAWHKKRF